MSIIEAILLAIVVIVAMLCATSIALIRMITKTEEFNEEEEK